MLEKPKLLRDLVSLYCTINTKVHSRGTPRLYHFAVASYSKHLGREALVDDLDDLTFAKWLEWRSAQVASATVAGEAKKLLAAWRWASTGKRQWVDGPDVTAPEEVHNPPKALDRDKMARLWKAANKSQRSFAGIPYNVYFPALLYVLWDSAERIGAVLQIERDDIHDAWINLDAEKRKGGKQGRQFKVRQQTVDALEKLLAATDADRPFAVRDIGTIYYHWRKVVEEAGLPKWITPHTIRRCHATHTEIAGGDASAALGHSSRRLTLESYIDPVVVAKHKPQACDTLFDPGRVGIWSRLFRRKATG